MADGIITVVPTPGFAWSVLLTFGTVLEPGEAFDSSRVLEAAGPGAAIEAFPERARHLHTHEGHHTFLNQVDRRVMNGDFIRRFTYTDEAPVLRERFDALAARGVTEIAYHPAGPDIPRELTAFARMAGVA